MSTRHQVAEQDMTDKVVVLAGAGGIATGVAKRLGERGANVVVGDIIAASAELAAKTVRDNGGDARSVVLDLTSEDSVSAWAQTAIDQFGGIDGLYNVAAEVSPDVQGKDTDLLATPLDVWQQVLDVNLLGYVRTIRAVLEPMLERGGGAIVNTMSAVVYVGEPERPAYAASKAALGALTRHVARRWGKQGVRANAVSPGVVLTPAAVGAVSEEFRESLLSGIMSPRLGEPADIAATVVHLLSDDGSWITGQVLNVDGGQTIRS